jgi:hypothetical protein
MSIRRLMFGDPDASVESQHLDDRSKVQSNEGAIKEDGWNSKSNGRTANGESEDEKVRAHTVSVRCTKRRRVLRRCLS